MAIVIEEEKNQTNIIGIVTWLVVILVVGIAAYYIFFARPQLVEMVAPSAFQNINTISKINLNPEEVVNSKLFQSLKLYVSLPVPGSAGRSNPFSPF